MDSRYLLSFCSKSISSYVMAYRAAASRILALPTGYIKPETEEFTHSAHFGRPRFTLGALARRRELALCDCSGALARAVEALRS